MIAIKRRCRFFDNCRFADSTSITCTQNGGDDCGTYRYFANFEKEEKDKNEKER